MNLYYPCHYAARNSSPRAEGTPETTPKPLLSALTKMYFEDLKVQDISRSSLNPLY